MKIETIGDLKKSQNNTLYFVGPQIVIVEQKMRIYNQCVFEGRSIKTNGKITFIGNPIKQNLVTKRLSQPRSHIRFFQDNDEIKLDGIKSIIGKSRNYTKITGIFDNLGEAEQYLKDEVKKLKREDLKYTLTLEQIAKTFNIPIDKLIIRGIYNDIY